jgi:ABC-type branched-subunit amino acid transport system substrate-binding protein
MRLPILVLASIFIIFESNAALIGYGSSDAVLPSKNQELFYMGFELGMQQYVNRKTFFDLVESIQISDGSHLGAQYAAKELMKNGAKILVGFPTSHEALLASKAIKSNEIVSIFAGAGHSELGRMGPNVYTTGESMESSVRAALDFIKRKFSGKKGVLIGNPFAVFSKDQDSHFKKLIEETIYSKISIDFQNLDKHLQIDPTLINKLKNNEYDYLVLSLYSDDSGKILEKLEKLNIDLPIVSNTSWSTNDIEYIRRYLANKSNQTFIPNIDIDNSSLRKFVKIFHSKFGKEPTSESSYGYDVGIIVGQMISKLGKNPKTEDIIKALQSENCFRNTSSGKICFPSNGGHSIRKLTFFKFTSQGLKPAE